PEQDGVEVPAANWLAGLGPESCPVELHARAEGSLDGLSIALAGNGQGMTLDADAHLTPLAAMPLESANLALVLPDGSSLKGKVGWDAAPSGEGVAEGEAEAKPSVRQLIGELSAQRLNVGHLTGGVTPPAVLGFDSRFRVGLQDGQTLRDIELDLGFHEGSQWNEQPLSGDIGVSIQLLARDPQSSSQSEADSSLPLPEAPKPLLPAELAGLSVQRFDTTLTLGKNRIDTQGAFGSADSELQLGVQVARLADFWPELPGGIEAKGNVAGSIGQHSLELQGRYTPANATRDELGTAPVALDIRAEGGWGGQPEGWRGRLTALEVDHAHLGVDLGAPLELHYLPTAAAPAWQLTAGSTEI